MNTKSAELVFEQVIHGVKIDRITFNEDGYCKIIFNDGTNQMFQTEHSTYNIQYGISFSIDETMLFISSWEKGLFAYEIQTGQLIWRYKTSKIRDILVFKFYIIAVQANEAILKIDIASGKLLNQIKSGSIERAYRLTDNSIAVDRIKGFLSVVDTNELITVFHYPNSLINPNHCLSILIQELTITGDQLMIQGVEEYPDRDFKRPGKNAFKRFVHLPIIRTG